MKHGSLFSGIGGFDLAAEWVGWENVFQVEWDDWCQKVLTKNFPDVKKYKDIKDFDGAEWRGRVDVISGGFPCQPFSQAGKRQGKADDRYLWPEMLRVISEIKSSFVIGENVAGILSMENGRTLERILFDLENEGYQVEVFVIPACAVGAWHRRDRVWIIAHADIIRGNNRKQFERSTIFERTKVGSEVDEYCKDVTDTNGVGSGKVESYVEFGQRRQKSDDAGSVCKNGTFKDAPNTNGLRFSNTPQRHTKTRIIRGRNQQAKDGEKYWKAEPGMGRVADGVSGRVDRLKGLGNAIVPQIAYEFYKIIDQISNQ